jgi:hypothetical protein
MSGAVAMTFLASEIVVELSDTTGQEDELGLFGLFNVDIAEYIDNAQVLELE